jgi:hypothetical protein
MPELWRVARDPAGLERLAGLFFVPDPVAENLAYGRPHASWALLKDALVLILDEQTSALSTPRPKCSC